MKIEKLYTLSQFVDYMNSKECKLYMENSLSSAVLKYNNFLKQPLTKDMFVSEAPRPNEGDYKVTELGEELACHQFSKDFDKWQEAEKNVIFEGFEYIKCIRNSGGNYTHILKFEETEIYMQWGGFHIYGVHKIKTILDLAEAPTGELKLKNVEI